MRPVFFRSLLVLAAAAGALALPAAASAQTVVVLGIRSVEGDDEFARNLTGALRHAASQVGGWTVSDSEVTLAQMALAHGCDDPDPACMAQVAQTLGAQRIVYGDVRRTSAGEPYDFSVNLHLFNAESGRIERSVADTIPGVRRDIDDLREPVRRYMSQLSGAPQTGSVRISVNVPGAEVFIDGEPVGTADGEGRLIITDVQAGSRNVRIVAPGHQSFRSTVSVEPFGEALFEAELQVGVSDAVTPSGGGGGPSVELITGVGLLVVAAGLAAGWIASWAHLRFGLNEDPRFIDYRRRVGTFVQATEGPSVDISGFDACALAASNPRLVHGSPPDVRMESTLDLAEHATAVCNEASTFEALEFVFGFSAAVAAGVGAFFLVTALTGGDSSGQQSWMLTPSFGPDHGYLGVAATF